MTTKTQRLSWAKRERENEANSVSCKISRLRDGGDMQSVRKTFKDRLKESDRRVQTDTDWKIGLKVDRKRNREIIWHKEDSANRTHL